MDPSGSLVPNCMVKAVNKGTSATRSTLTGASGDYTLVNMEPGEYEITVQAPGFEITRYSGLTLMARQTIRQDAHLALASQGQTVSVTAATEAPINTEVSSIAETKVGRELTDLPVAIYSRASGSTSAITTLTTQPGVETDASGNISVAGAKPSMLSSSLDGISTVSPKGSAPISELFPSFDTIAEIRVSEINNAAEFGGISDITTISKSGSNVFHGGLFENNQTSSLDARNTFAAAVPHLVMNDFGGFLGGPVTVPKLYHGTDRTFFFMSYEGLRRPNQAVIIDSVPTAAMRTGDLSIYLPKTVVKDPTTGSPFPNNQIPANRISPLSSAAANYFFPLPNYGAANSLANNYETAFPTPISSNQGDLRVDRNITSKQTAFARLTYKRRETLSQPGGSVNLGGGDALENDYGLTVAHNYVISAHLVNEARAGYTGVNTGTNYPYTAAGIQQALGLQLAGPPPPGAAAPSFSITGFTGTNGGTTTISRTNTRQILDDLTWTRGRHSVKVGGDFRYLTGLYTNVFASSRMGSYSFNNSVTSSLIGSPFGAFLLGIPDSSGMATVLNPDTDGYAKHFAAYAQDDWKVTQRLTLNFGLRWEYHPAFRDHYNNTANFLLAPSSIQNGVTVHGAVVIPDAAVPLVNPAFAQSIAPTPILTATQAGLPQSLRYSEKFDFAPRIGFAWRVTSDGKTVIRGGYGKFIEAELGSLIDAAWAVEASDVAKFTNQIVSGKPLYSFPYALPANLAQPGSQVFDLAGDIHYKDPYVQQWNFTVERDLGFQTGLRVSYDGSHGSDLGVTTNPDQVPANTVGFATATKSEPYPLLAQIIYLTNAARSNYNALTVTVNKRFYKGLQFQASYNYARNLSNGGGYAPGGFASEGGGTLTDPMNPNLDYGNVAYTRRDRFETTFLYDLPFGHAGHSVVNQLIGGWELAGVLVFQTGPFLTVVASGADPSGTNFPNLQGSGRADRTLGTSLYPASQSASQWLNPAAFAVPANNIGRFGTAPIGAVDGPGTQAVSLSFFRTINFTERAHLRVGLAAANALNHPNYGNPALTLNAPTFGTITTLQSAEGAGPRQLQLTARITF
ncbi:MAG: carboxypeptidase regulatory-like domain-containing protein [Candidatus Sulfopaludibacter sp.]|nr:carboxypeptidase regulatory-like domain-containing protein [Candidatus Sulfopaludibacter sp.]